MVSPGGVIGVVHKVGTDWTGEWMFQLRYLNRTVKRGTSPWSLNYWEKDLDYFVLIGSWLTAQALLTSPGKPKKATWLKAPTWMRGKGHPNQLRLFEDF
jgi:hypothetical protein